MARLVPQLPLEIITDILARLSVKPLLRFKCVSKSWNSLISTNPEFAKLHLHYAKRDSIVHRHRLLLSTYPFQSIDHEAFCDGDTILPRELSGPSRATDTEIELEFIGSCNGLISAGINSNSQIIVWNPTTGDSRELPTSDFSMIGEVFFGFGYDPHVDDYKVVRGVASSEVKMEVFSLKGNTWRSIKDQNCNVSLKGSPTCANGMLHWLITLENDHQNQRLGIVLFDLAEEKFLETILVPDEVPKSLGLDLKIVGVGDEVCLCSGYYAEVYEGWRMKGHGREVSWSKLYSFRSDPLPGCKYWLEVLWVAKNGNVVFNLDGWELVLYNPKRQTVLQYNVNWDWFETITYIESLLSPNNAQCLIE